MRVNPYEWDLILATKKDEASDPDDEEQMEQQVKEAIREWQKEAQIMQIDRESSLLEKEAEAQENIDNHRDEPPFES